MKYLIGCVFLGVTLSFLAIDVRIVFLAFTAGWEWILLGIPFVMLTVVSGLIASVGLTAPKNY